MQLEQIVSEVLDVDLAEITDDTGPATNAVWTSLAHIEVVMAVEDAYGVALTAQEIDTVRSVGALRRLITRKLGENGAHA